jgi:RNA polymerase II subunit A small phosphatase-like protein
LLITYSFGIEIETSGRAGLLKPQKSDVKGRKTLVLDLDETLVHSSFKPPKKTDIVLPVDIEGRICHVYVLVRPGCL